MANKIIIISFYIQMNLKLNLFIIMISILMINFIKSDNCLITNNTVIIKQWLNNIICLGNNSRYVNFATSSNNDMIIETTSIPGSPKRIFYGIKSNGEPILVMENIIPQLLFLVKMNQIMKDMKEKFFLL